MPIDGVFMKASFQRSVINMSVVGRCRRGNSSTGRADLGHETSVADPIPCSPQVGTRPAARCVATAAGRYSAHRIAITEHAGMMDCSPQKHISRMSSRGLMGGST